MPNHFIALDVNTPEDWRGFHDTPVRLQRKIASTVKKFGGSVVGGLYFDIGRNVGYVVTKGPEDPSKAKAMIEALPTLKATVMLRVEEMKEAVEEGKKQDP